MAERVDPSWQLWYDIRPGQHDDEIAQEEIDCIMDQAEACTAFRCGAADASIYVWSATNQA